MTNASQTTTGTLNYDAFGVQIGTTGSSTNPFQFGGTSHYRNDGDAGLTLVGARYYDAQVGRFITRDTVLSEAPYVYCDGDPVNALDPSGHGPIGRWLVANGKSLQDTGSAEIKIGVGLIILGGILWLCPPPIDAASGPVAIVGTGVVANGWEIYWIGVGMQAIGRRLPI